MAESSPTKRGFWYVVLAGVIAAVIGGVILSALLGGFNPSTQEATAIAPPPDSSSTPPVPTVSATPAPDTVPGAGTQYLAELEPTEGYSGDGVREVGGDAFPHSLFKDLGGCDKDGSLVFNLSKDWTELNLTVGLDDTSDLDAAVETTIFADGIPVFESGKLLHGERLSPVIPVAGVLSLKLEYVFLEGNMGQCSHAGLIVWGEPTLTR